MTLAEWVLALTWIGVTAYALLGGADFGAGMWDLVAGGARRGRAERALIEHSIGPVWEANHVWLIFVLVILWTAFPAVFAAVASTLYVPLTLVAFGVIARGAAFAFRKAIPEMAVRRLFGAAFAFSSLVTPFFLGTVAGAVASGRVPPGSARGDPLTSWWNPTSVLGGAMAVGVCAYLAAVYLTADAERARQADLAERFRRRALGTGVAVGALALAGIGVLAADAPRLYQGLTGRALPLVAASAAFGLASLTLLWRRRFQTGPAHDQDHGIPEGDQVGHRGHAQAPFAVRVTAACAVVAVVWGWAVGQYPYMLEPDLTIAAAAAGRATLQAMLAALGVGAVLLVPALAWLFILFQRTDPPPAAPTRHPQGW